MALYRFGVVCFSLLLGAVATVAAEENSERFEKVAQRMVEAINAQNYAAAQQDFSPGLLKVLPLEKLKPILQGLTDQWGKIEKLAPPRLASPKDAVFAAHFARTVLDVRLALDEKNQITGLLFSASAQMFEQVTQRLVDAINAEDYTAVQKDFSKQMLDALPLEKSKQFFQRLLEQFGKIEKLNTPRLTAPNRAVVSAHCTQRDLEITITLDNRFKIGELSFLPSAQAISVPDKLATSFHLPFNGQWLVLWGGDSKELNHHHDSPHQRFAFDFVVADQEGRTHQGEGKENKDYYAFGQPVLAPADGVVTDVIEGVRDNKPGSMNLAFAGGNTVILSHREQEVSILAHFQQGSIRVKCGEKVKRGQVLGLCGNSGSSTEPHIHFHVQNTPILQDATGLPCEFEKVAVMKDGKSELKTSYSPVKGDRVKQE